MQSSHRHRYLVPGLALALLWVVLLAPAALAHEPDFTSELGRERCTFGTFSNNPWFPLWPGYALRLEGEEEDDGELLELTLLVTVLPETELVDGVRTRVVQEREWEDGELVEVSRNFMAECRETGAIWYFGEDVDDYEDGEIVSHGGEWRAGVAGAVPGIIMPGTPLIGARFQEELAPGVAEDRGEVLAVDEDLTVPVGSFEDVLLILDGSALDPEAADEKYYAPGVGIVKDEALELVEITPPPCVPDDHTLCLNDGRFRVRAEWTDFELNEGMATAQQISDDSGELWFFSAANVELLVKVLDGCGVPGSQAYWVFAAGLTNVEVTLTVTDLEADETQIYENPLGNPFDPVLDTAAFATCP